MRRVLGWAVGVALVVAAGAVTAVTPSEDSLRRGFAIGGAEGEQVHARLLTASIRSATFAERVTGDEWGVDGNWLVLEVVASAPRSEEDAELLLATLVIDGRVFLASERPPESLLRTPLRVGADTVGMLAFELPTDLRTGSAELRLSTTYITPELDDVAVLPVTLDDVSVADELEITEPELVGLP